MKTKTSIILTVSILFTIGFLAGAFFANSGGISLSKADPQDEMPLQQGLMPGSMNYGGYYGGYRMGMGMGMMGPMYGYGMTGNTSYYGSYGMGMMGMGMGMGMMGMSPMYGYGYNDTYYNGYYAGLCPGCGMGGYGMYNGYPYYYNGTSSTSGAGVDMNMTSSSAQGNVVTLTNDHNLAGSSTETTQSTLVSSPYAIAGLGTGFLIFAPISWKILHRRKN
jgi:hypothetical protein